jgi:uncharacterized protein (TIGR00255 family)
MLRSMTGFGAATTSSPSEDEQVSVEIRSVNQKFIDIKLRAGRELAPFEAEIVAAVKAVLARGAIDVQVHRKSLRGNVAVAIDLPLARAYAEAFAEVSKALALSEPLPARVIFEAEGVLRLEERAAAPDQLRSALRAAVDAALKQVLSMREREGVALGADLTERLANVGRLLDQVEQLIPNVLAEQRRRLKGRIAEVLQRELDEQRLAQEVALLVDRSDVTEEVTRLRAHLAQFGELLRGEVPAGRRLDFLAQEIHREITTLGNKSQSAEIARLIIELKAEAERLREQVQNVE